MLGNLLLKKRWGGVVAVCDDLGIDSPVSSKYYDEYNLVKASPPTYLFLPEESQEKQDLI